MTALTTGVLYSKLSFNELREPAEDLRRFLVFDEWRAFKSLKYLELTSWDYIYLTSAARRSGGRADLRPMLAGKTSEL